MDIENCLKQGILLDNFDEMFIIIVMEQKVESIIAQNLIDLRKNKGLKQTDLSEAIGYSDKTISRWENGTSVPDISTLIKLANFYSITINDIIQENAIEKTIEDRPEIQTKAIKDASNLGLTILTVWLIAVMIYVGMMLFNKPPLWQIFICAIPITAFLGYRHTSRNYNIKWLDFIFLSLLNFSFITAIYLIIVEYNFWQLFLLTIPLEGMCVINTFFKKKISKKNKNK